MDIVQYTLYSIHYRNCIFYQMELHCFFYILYFILYIVQCILYNIHCTIYIVQYTLYNIHCAIYIVQCISCTFNSSSSHQGELVDLYLQKYKKMMVIISSMIYVAVIASSIGGKVIKYNYDQEPTWIPAWPGSRRLDRGFSSGQFLIWAGISTSNQLEKISLCSNLQTQSVCVKIVMMVIFIAAIKVQILKLSDLH